MSNLKMSLHSLHWVCRNFSPTKNMLGNYYKVEKKCLEYLKPKTKCLKNSVVISWG